MEKRMVKNIHFTFKRYEGNWRDGKKNDQGIFTWSNGTKYVGKFKNDEVWN